AALKSATTKIALSNSGSSVALFGSDGNQLGATVTYSKAIEGSSWARIDDNWQWSSTPTPGSANVITATPSTAATSSATASKSSSSKAATSKTKSTTAPKASKAPVGSAPAALAAGATSTGGHWLLFIL